MKLRKKPAPETDANVCVLRLVSSWGRVFWLFFFFCGGGGGFRGQTYCARNGPPLCPGSREGGQGQKGWWKMLKERTHLIFQKRGGGRGGKVETKGCKLGDTTKTTEERREILQGKGGGVLSLVSIA